MTTDTLEEVAKQVDNLEKKVDKHHDLFSQETLDLFTEIYRMRKTELLRDIRFAWIQKSMAGELVFIRKGPFLIRLSSSNHCSYRILVIPKGCEVVEAPEAIEPTVRGEGQLIDVSEASGPWVEAIETFCDTDGELRAEVEEHRQKTKTKDQLKREEELRTAVQISTEFLHTSE